MNDQALNQARDESRELAEAEAQLDRDAKRQNIFGGFLILVMLASCLGFIGGALYVANEIGMQVRVYMDGTNHEEDF